ncbi:MAG: penicillin acylase family protein [Acidobacteria bacterium]|nr:penicillin acylase family protein [Acidobacteriota bacterium]
MWRRIAITLVTIIFTLSVSAQTERFKLPGMKKAGTITRDDLGVAHIFALNEHDLLFLQGWVHAEDRFFQMDFNRRLASGTLAELVGQPALSNDVLLRTLGLRRAAEGSWARTAPDTREALMGYAKGVNAWLATNELPAEYGALEITEVPPWTPIDTLSIAKLLAFGLSFDLDTDRTIAFLTWVQVGNAVGFNGTAMFFEDLFRIEPFGDASTVPDASAIAGKGMTTTAPASKEELYKAYEAAAQALPEGVLDLAESVSQAFSSPYLSDVMDPDFFLGSNEWGIGPQLSASGQPMIANDPHLALDTPSTFYPNALQAGDINVIGMSFAGVPYVAVGRTPDLAWGATVNPMDVTDVFAEEIVVVPQALAGLATRHGDDVEWLFPVLQTWRVNTIGDGVNNSLQTIPPGGSIPRASLIVVRRNAPIIALDVQAGTALSVQYTGFNATQEIEMLRRVSRSSTIEEFRDALRWFDFGSQNWAVLDSSGDYGYFTSAELPLREDLEAGTVNGLPPFFIRNGTGGNDWIRNLNPPPAQATPNAILPFSEMPQIVNPPAGFFVNANNDPAGTTLDNNPLNQLRPTGGIFYLNVGYDGFRGERVTEMIEAKIANGETISFEEIQQMQADTVMVDAEYFVPWIIQAFDNARTPGAHPGLAQFAASPPIQAAVARLSSWDFSTPTGIPEGFDASDENGQLSSPSETEIAHSVAATIYSVWRGRFIANTIDTVIGAIEQGAGRGLPRPGSGSTLSSLRNFLDNWETTRGVGASGLNFFNVPGVDDPSTRRDILILKSVGDAIGLITSEEFAPAFGRSTDMNDWNWGKLHRIVFDHPLGGPLSVPPAGGLVPAPLPGLPGIPTDGGFGTIDASSHNARADGVNEFMFGSGPARRFAAEATGDGIRAETSLPGGTSGSLGSPFHLNLLPMWLTNESFPSVLRPVPSIPWLR